MKGLKIILLLCAVAFSGDRYRVLTGNWDAALSWSTTSGGIGGASVPSSADNCYFDAGTPSGTHTVNLAATCLSLTARPPASGNITLAGSSALSIAGSESLYVGFVASGYTGTRTATATTTGWTFTENGAAFTSSPLTFSGAGGGWTVVGNMTGAAITYTAGAVSMNGLIRCYVMTSNAGGSDRSLSLNNSAVIIESGNGNMWNMTSANLTFNAGTSNISLITPGQDITFAGGGQTYNRVSLDSRNRTSERFYTITGSNTFASLGIRSGSSIKVTDGTTQTIGAIDVMGAGNSNNLTTITGTSTAGYTLSGSAANTKAADYMNVSYATCSGSGSWYMGANSTNGGNNSGCTFSAAPGTASIYPGVVPATSIGKLFGQ